MHSTDQPSIQASWNGLVLDLNGPAACRIVVTLDGSRFVELQTDARGHAGLEIPYSPSGRAILPVQAHCRGDSPAAAARAFSIEIGKSGVHPLAGCGDSGVAPGPIGGWLPTAAEPMQAEVAIIIPVYNAAASVKRCLDSVLANSSGRCRVIVIDDASTEQDIAPMLDAYRGIPGVEILANPANLGFTATVNRGMSLAGQADVVLLNADTEVASQWLTGLRRAVYSSADVATATAVSNNAGAFSVPELECENRLPAGWTFAQTARALWQSAGHVYPQLPTGNGFCMYIRRSVLNQIGLFDVEAFPQGYGEENDFCQRACAGGYRHVIAGNVFVLHARSMSFGTQRREALGRAGMQVLRERWPDYESDVGRELFSFDRRVLDWRVRRIHALATHAAPLPRLLRYGPQADPASLCGYDMHELTLDGIRLSLDDQAIGQWQPTRSATGNQACISGLLEDHAIELMEIGRGMDPTLVDTLREQADRLGIPVLLLEKGQSARPGQRESALHSLNRFAGVTR